MLDGACCVLRKFIAFDLVTFAEYAVDRAASDSILALGRYAVDDGKRFDWPARWLRVPKVAIQSHAGKDVVLSDMEASFADPALAELRSNPVIQTYLQRGARSLLAALFWENDQLVASLTLARKGNSFNEQDKADLEALTVADGLRRIRGAYQAKAAAFRQEMRDLFAERAQPGRVAPLVVRRLCEHFRWNYVAIFRVAGIRDRFELVDQYALDKRLLIDKNYSQPLEKGVLGRVKRTGGPLRVEDTLAHTRHGYRRIAPDARSCLCCPIKVDGVVEWILDCESAEVGAFQYPDEVELGTLIREAEKTVALWFEMRLNRALIENMDQGVIVVDRENRITRLNAQAAHLLGASPTAQDDLDAKWDLSHVGVQPQVRGRLLTDFGAGQDAKDDLEAGHVAIKQLHLLGADGVVRNVAASSREAEDAFNRRIWRLSDPKIWNWVTALEYMRTTVQSVAQQTRGPLLLANALIAKSTRLMPDNIELQDLLSKARACLAKTDITYERLVDVLTVQRNPIGSPVAVDVSVAIERFLTSLPPEDRRAVIVTCAESVPAAWVDPNRLDFVIRSTLGYLLASHLPTSKITVDVAGSDDEIAVNITCAVQEADGFGQVPADSDPLAVAKAEAQEAATHALSSVRKAIEINRGGNWMLDHARGKLVLHFGLPSPLRARGKTVLAHE
ncbi:PAS domain-containing protein [Bradyrhizobium sp. 197]|uniref:GAF domain-containing protein n=1 Tax=Bradyrhizobium sp. 197 TaxID=2782663 RepID=UPI001FF7A171|nr:GAF domain-containing protein [Bradyrhizobium sp. 197]MCK1481027.1 PAS domain-containing protein [Bradyrhizobium sp. 197]